MLATRSNAVVYDNPLGADNSVEMDEPEEPAVTGCRLLLFAGAGVSDGKRLLR